MAISLYRKYRPETFDEVVGQEHVEKTLVNALYAGALAHAYLFCGPRGTGKTTTARLLAKALLCEKAAGGGEPDGSCGACRQIAAGTHPDVYELDAASRTGVDNVREEIVNRVQFSPIHGSHKVYIVDEVHMLSTAAFNALLKTLEEPPEHVVFVLCTTDPQKVPATIQSRCQRFDFHRLSEAEIAGYLRRICDGEGFSADDGALAYIAQQAAGGMRDATTALEQVAVASGGQVTLAAAQVQLGRTDSALLFELGDKLAARDVAGCLGWLARFVDTGADLAQFSRDLAGHVRNLYVAQVAGADAGLLSCPAGDVQRFGGQAAAFGGAARLSYALETCSDLQRALRNASDVRLDVEVALVKLCRPEEDGSLAALAARVERLEQGGGGATAAAVPAAAAGAYVSDDMPPSSFAPSPEAQRESASAPASELAPAAASGGAGAAAMSPARLTAAVIAAVKHEDVATSTMLAGTSVADAGDGSYVLAFPKGAEFAMKLASQPEAARLIERGLRSVVGQTARLVMRLEEQAAGRPAVAASGPSFGSVRMQRAGDEAQDGAGDRTAGGSDDVPFDVDEPPFYPEDEPWSAPPRDVPFSLAPDEPDFDGGPAAHVPLDDATAASLSETLSAFGPGIKLREVDDPAQNDSQSE